MRKNIILEVESQLQILSSIKDQKGNLLILNILDVLDKREEHEYFLRNPNLFEFRKIKRPQTAGKYLTPRQTHPQLFYQPNSKVQKKLRMELLKTIVERPPSQSNMRSPFRDEFKKVLLLRTLNKSMAKALESHSDQIIFEKSDTLKEILSHREQFHKKKNQLTNSSIKIRDLVQRKPIQLEAQSTPFLCQDEEVQKIVKQQEFTKFEKVMLFQKLRRQIINPEKGEELLRFSSKYKSHSIIQLKNNEFNAYSQIKNVNGAIGTVYLSTPLPSNEQVIKRYQDKETNSFYFEFKIVNVENKVQQNQQQEKKINSNTHSQCYCRFGLATLNFQYDYCNQIDIKTKATIQVDPNTIRGYQSVVIGDDVHSFGISTHDQKCFHRRNELNTPGYMLDQLIHSQDNVGVLICLDGLARKLLLIEDQKKREAKRLHDFMQKQKTRPINEVKEDLFKNMPKFLSFKSNDEESKGSVTNRSRNKSKNNTLNIKKSNTMIRLSIQKEMPKQIAEPNDLFMEIFSNGKSIGLINLPLEIFQSKSGVYLAFNVYPLNYLKLNTGQRPFKYDPSVSSLSFRKFKYLSLQSLVEFHEQLDQEQEEQHQKIGI
ncbi:UNKNOWN [Stylonychia lemnae]|uniref:Uncharacterized protein n=1 Tax=Stylonychia lemnae TaxID=5949 RepID=A0A077ZNL0_STYLE|nr:UNKNOWN [Stylonychia lemnae]|eukprot:CDW71503.1 UNKNOWN [Stylonychia lemnae]